MTVVIFAAPATSWLGGQAKKETREKFLHTVVRINYGSSTVWSEYGVRLCVEKFNSTQVGISWTVINFPFCVIHLSALLVCG